MIFSLAFNDHFEGGKNLSVSKRQENESDMSWRARKRVLLRKLAFHWLAMPPAVTASQGH
jgi:hypothetical protein